MLDKQPTIEYAYNGNKPEYEPDYLPIRALDGVYTEAERARQLHDAGFRIVQREVIRGEWETYNG